MTNMEGEQNNVNMSGGEGGSPVSPIIGVVVILALAILGGLYFWSQRAGNEATPEEVKIQDNTDEAAVIEADLNATDIENLDAELNAS